MNPSTSVAWNSNPLHYDSPSMNLQQVADDRYNTAEQQQLMPPHPDSAPKITQLQANELLKTLETPSNGKSKAFTAELHLNRTLFLAGDEVSGRLELECKVSKKAMLGNIDIHVFGIEEIIQTKIHTRRLFLHCTQSLQNPLLAPSDAVFACPPDTQGMWAAKKGKTVFSFTIAVPKQSNVVGDGKNVPGSCWVKDVGGVRYFVVATISIKESASTKTLNPMLPIQLVSSHATSLSSSFATTYPTTVEQSAEKNKRIGRWYEKKGEVVLKADMHLPRVDEGVGVWVAGGIGFVNVEVKNMSKKLVKTLSISLIRRTKTFSPSSNSTQLTPLSFIRHILTTKTYKPSSPPKKVLDVKYVDGVETVWNGVKQEESVRVCLELSVPKDVCTVEGKLIEVSYCVNVSTDFGLSVELPVKIVHPLSLMTSLPPLNIKYTTPVSQPTMIAAPAEIPTVMNPLYTPVESPMGSYTARTAPKQPRSVSYSSLTSSNIAAYYEPENPFGTMVNGVQTFARTPTPGTTTLIGDVPHRPARRAPPPPPPVVEQERSREVSETNSNANINESPLRSTLMRSNSSASNTRLTPSPLKRGGSISRRAPFAMEPIRRRPNAEIEELIRRINTEEMKLEEEWRDRTASTHTPATPIGNGSDGPVKKLERMEDSGVTVVEEEVTVVC